MAFTLKDMQKMLKHFYISINILCHSNFLFFFLIFFYGCIYLIEIFSNLLIKYVVLSFVKILSNVVLFL